MSHHHQSKSWSFLHEIVLPKNWNLHSLVHHCCCCGCNYCVCGFADRNKSDSLLELWADQRCFVMLMGFIMLYNVDRGLGPSEIEFLWFWCCSPLGKRKTPLIFLTPASPFGLYCVKICWWDRFWGDDMCVYILHKLRPALDVMPREVISIVNCVSIYFIKGI